MIEARLAYAKHEEGLMIEACKCLLRFQELVKKVLMTLPGFILGLPFGLLLGMGYIDFLSVRLPGTFLPVFNDFLNRMSECIQTYLPTDSKIIFLAALLAIHLLLVWIPYMIAGRILRKSTGNIVKNKPELCRGTLFGMNWGINMIILYVFIPFAMPLIMLVQLPMLVPAISTGSRYLRNTIAWMGWLLPMSVFVNSAGLLLFLLNVLISFLKIPSVKLSTSFPVKLLANGILKSPVASISFDWRKGIIIMQGGYFTIYTGGFNLGNFIFIHTSNEGSAFQNLLLHETGHTLNVSAFGYLFHTINAVDENILRPESARQSYGEMAAESYRKGKNNPYIDLW